MTPLSLVSVPFQGDWIQALQDKVGAIWVSPSHVCNTFGINWATQFRKLQNASWGCVVMMTMQVGGQRRQVAMIPLKAVPIWLAGITPSKVKVGLRAKLVDYQNEAAEVLSAWFLGVSDVPGLVAALNEAKEQVILAREQVSLANKQVALAREESANFRDLSDLMLHPLIPSAEGEDEDSEGHNLWMTVRVFTDLVGIRNIAGEPMTTNSLKSAGHALSKLSRLFGIEIRKTEGRMPVAAYRLDVLQTWHAMTTVGVRVPASLYEQLVRGKLIVN